MAIKIEEKSKRSKSYEMQVFAICKEISQYAESLYDFRRMFIERIVGIKKQSYTTADNQYSLRSKGSRIEDFQPLGESMELWHLDSKGDPDRLCLIISKI